MKVLLTSVFGPFGVDDEYGRKLNVMELFHNQVTREQGLYSLRMNHPSFGLYLIAENLQAPTAVLDFPTLDRFIAEIKKNYDVIGISFIVANFSKAKKMTELIRQLSPHTKIVLGGHGTNIRGIDKLIDFDYISSGEGVSWFRRLLKEDPAAPLRHPAMMSTLQRRVMGIPVPASAAVLIPGLGCVNACSFCATSHHFGKKYIGYLNTGQELFDTMCEIERKTGCNEFFVMDENFLKNRPRAEELLEIMERHQKYFYLGVFSSAETINALGVEFMAKLGIDFVWIGVESKASMFQKTKGVDLKEMIRTLRSYGIQVLGSAILFLDHHQKENIQEDIDFVTDLETDFVQFMELGPLPGTALYEEYESQGRLRLDVPYLEWHGQDKIWFDHPHFSRDETTMYLKNAFTYEFKRNGPSLLRLADTSLHGYLTACNHNDPRIAGLLPRLKNRCSTLRPLLQAARTFAPNPATKALAARLIESYAQVFGPDNLLDKLASSIVHVFAAVESYRIKHGGNMRQPPTQYVTYRMSWAEKLGWSKNPVPLQQSRPAIQATPLLQRSLTEARIMRTLGR